MTDARTTDDPLVYTRTVVGHAAFHAGQHGRTDLVERLDHHRVLLDQLEGATVAVVGLCDAGKSSLINACVGQVVVPVDLVHPTPVPVVVTAGDGTVRIHHLDERDDGAGPVTGRLNELEQAFAAPATQLAQLRLVEVGCPFWTRPASLVFVDTPSQSIGTASARALLTGMDPDVLVLASDAGQELSQLELATITAARHHNTQIIIALTKVDLHAHWRRILEVNQEHLRRAGMSVPILPVSSRLYDLGRSGNDGSLSNESGIVPLLDYLDQAATGAREVYVCSRALAAVADVTADLTDELRSQHDAADRSRSGAAEQPAAAEGARSHRATAGRRGQVARAPLRRPRAPADGDGPRSPRPDDPPADRCAGGDRGHRPGGELAGLLGPAGAARGRGGGLRLRRAGRQQPRPSPTTSPSCSARRAASR